jgi:hypothetical protein
LLHRLPEVRGLGLDDGLLRSHLGQLLFGPRHLGLRLGERLGRSIGLLASLQDLPRRPLRGLLVLVGRLGGGRARASERRRRHRGEEREEGER